MQSDVIQLASKEQEDMENNASELASQEWQIKDINESLFKVKLQQKLMALEKLDQIITVDKSDHKVKHFFSES